MAVDRFDLARGGVALGNGETADAAPRGLTDKFTNQNCSELGPGRMRREKRISMRELVRCRIRGGAISSITPVWDWRRYLSAFGRSPALDQGEGRAPSARLGQLGLGLAAQRGELVSAQCPK
jgi:hypothetical protein